MLKSFRNAFTLAEVLITLGIIGVVAAMTMPTLMNSTNGAQYRIAYKKALSVLSQAVVLNIALDDYDMSQTTATGTDTASASLYAMFNNRMNVVKTETTGDLETGKDAPITYLKVTKVEGEDGADDTVSLAEVKNKPSYILSFNDGIQFSFPIDAKGCTEAEPCYGLIDVNGPKNPNKPVVCDDETDYKKMKADCEVSNPTDQYHVVMYDQTILPITDAGKAVLYGGK